MYTFTLRIYDTETNETSELLSCFNSDEEAVAYFEDISEAYPENFDYEVIWTLKDDHSARAALGFPSVSA